MTTKMSADDMVSVLKENVVTLEFIKSNGSLRKMKATLQPDMLPKAQAADEHLADGAGLISVYDLGINEWRSFYSDSVEDFAPVS